MGKILFQEVDYKNLLEDIDKLIETKINQLINQKNDNQQGELWTRKDTAKHLRITLPTLNKLTKNGDIPSYRVKNRVLYKSEEVKQVIVKRQFTAGSEQGNAPPNS